MIDRIGKDSALAREALRAALKQASERAGAAPASPALAPETSSTSKVDFGRVLASGLDAIDQNVQGAENLATDLLSGKITDFHEIAVQLKSAELSFKFAMEIRNKLVDAYREIMRMGV